jgi:hypothetical protein
MNKENIQKFIDLVKSNPACWDQAHWHCGTTHCFAGHGQIMSGRPANTETVRKDARIFYDLNKGDADWAFNPNRTLEDIEQLVVSNGYDCDGYNRDGYNRYGYDCDGYDCDGLDKNNQPKSNIK